jgi:hypothetical protein
MLGLSEISIAAQGHSVWLGTPPVLLMLTRAHLTPSDAVLTLQGAGAKSHCLCQTTPPLQLVKVCCPFCCFC